MLGRTAGRAAVPLVAAALMAAALMAVSAVSAASAQDEPGMAGMAAWDLDGDGAISREEFRLGMGTLGVYRRWDSDHDGMLTDEEFRATAPPALENVDAGFWTAWNLDDDADLDEEELGAGYFARFDRDGDGALDRPEWRLFRDYAREQGWLGG